MIEAFPLHWPIGYKRTKYRKRSQFKQTPDRAQKFLRNEVEKLRGVGLIISTNIPVRKDGGYYSEYSVRQIEDPGVAIYFKYKGKEISMCCDQYLTVWENIYALGRGIEALRGMERWGVSDFIDRAFTGFTALPENTQHKKMWWEILDLGPAAGEEEIKAAYRTLAKKYHPDVNKINPEYFNEVQRAYGDAINQL